MDNLNSIIGNNISKYRKLKNITQLELAESINFSDKSVSKWERGEGVPDVVVLKQICDILGVTLNDIIGEKENPQLKTAAETNIYKRNHLVIALVSAMGVWALATVIYVALLLAGCKENAWLSFIIAIPVFFLVLLVFACLWGKRYQIYILISCLLWTTLVAICIPTNAWELIYIAIPLQVVEIFCFFIKLPRKNSLTKSVNTTFTPNENDNKTKK